MPNANAVMASDIMILPRADGRSDAVIVVDPSCRAAFTRFSSGIQPGMVLVNGTHSRELDFSHGAIWEGTRMSATSTARIGLFGIGLAAYWPQFPHLKAATERHLGDVGARIGQWADVVLAGIVDTAQAGVAAGEKFAEARVDLVVCYSSVYATSTQVMPVVQRAGVPVLILNLQPEIALDYETAGTAVCLENSGICPVPEMAGVFARSGIPFRVVTGHLHGDEVAWSQVESWCRAAGAAKALKQGRFGMLGHTYPGMIDMSTDLGVVAGQLGAHVEVLEIDDLKERVRGVTDDAITVARQGVE